MVTLKATPQMESLTLLGPSKDKESIRRPLLLSTYKREGESVLVACGVSKQDAQLFCLTVFTNRLPKASTTLEDPKTGERFKVRTPESFRNQKGQFSNITLEVVQ